MLPSQLKTSVMISRGYGESVCKGAYNRRVPLNETAITQLTIVVFVPTPPLSRPSGQPGYDFALRQLQRRWSLQ